MCCISVNAIIDQMQLSDVPAGFLLTSVGVPVMHGLWKNAILYIFLLN